jgi:hypothetical protein
MSRLDIKNDVLLRSMIAYWMIAKDGLLGSLGRDNRRKYRVVRVWNRNGGSILSVRIR